MLCFWQQLNVYYLRAKCKAIVCWFDQMAFSDKKASHKRPTQSTIQAFQLYYILYVSMRECISFFKKPFYVERTTFVLFPCSDYVTANAKFKEQWFVKNKFCIVCG